MKQVKQMKHRRSWRRWRSNCCVPLHEVVISYSTLVCRIPKSSSDRIYMEKGMGTLGKSSRGGTG